MDSRFKLKAEFTIYGRTFKWEPSLNWHADPGACDARIVEWFVNCHAEAEADHVEKQSATYAAAQQIETERREREELKRLRAKYPE